MKNLKTVNQYIANLAVLNIKTHNLHFNVVGSSFKNVHEYLESIYNTYFEYYDAVAELVKMQGQMPSVSTEEYMKAATIKEVPAIVLKDLEVMTKAALKIREGAEKEDNFLLANMMEDHVAYYMKQRWFISATLYK